MTIFFISLWIRSLLYTFCCLISPSFLIDSVTYLPLFLTPSLSSVSFKLLQFLLIESKHFINLIWSVFFTAYIALSLQSYFLSSVLSKYWMVYFYIVLTFCPPTFSLISKILPGDWAHWSAVRSQVACLWLNLKCNSCFIRLNLSVTSGTQQCLFYFLQTMYPVFLFSSYVVAFFHRLCHFSSELFPKLTFCAVFGSFQFQPV